MRRNAIRYAFSHAPTRKIASLFWTTIFLFTFLVNAWAGIKLVPIHPDNLDTSCAISDKQNVPDMVASLLEAVKTKLSAGAVRRFIQPVQSVAIQDLSGLWQNTCGPSISYGICTLFQDNNQQAFLRLDLPPPSGGNKNLIST